MYRGQDRRAGPRGRRLRAAGDPYTQTLLAAVPSPTRARRGPSGNIRVVSLPPLPADEAAARADAQAAAAREEWAYEQKLDGFRAIVFVDGEGFYVQSRGGKDLTRYFPELGFAPGRYVLDGELVIRDAEGNLEFDALQQRIHPAESRIALLSREIPAAYVAFICWQRARRRCWMFRSPSGGPGWRRWRSGRAWS